MNQRTIDKQLDQMIEKAERDIDVVFARRLKVILSYMAELYRKYPDGQGISRTEIYKYNRFEKEMNFIKNDIQKDYKGLYQEIHKLMMEGYMQNYLRSSHLYEMAAKMSMQYTIPSAGVIEQAIVNPIAELTLSALMNQHRNEILRKIRIEVAQSIQGGESYSEMAKRLENALGFSSVKAKRVARTEAGRSQTLARLKSAEQAEQYADLDKTWASTLDKRTRPSHRVLDDNEPDEQGFFHFKGNKAQGPRLWIGPNSASLSINCRCTLLYLVNGQRPELRRARDYDDVDYQQLLADRIDELMANEGLTEKQATRKAKKQIYPPNKVMEYMSYEKWRESLLN